MSQETPTIKPTPGIPMSFFWSTTIIQHYIGPNSWGHLLLKWAEVSQWTLLTTYIWLEIIAQPPGIMMPFLRSIPLLEAAQRGSDIWELLQGNMDMELWRTLTPTFTLWGTPEENLTITPTPGSRTSLFSSITPAEPNNKFFIHWNFPQGQSQHLLKIAPADSPKPANLKEKSTFL